MESKHFDSHDLEIKLYHYKDIADLHYKLLSIFSLICYNSNYYCFCNKCQGCEKNYHMERTSAHFIVLRYVFVKCFRFRQFVFVFVNFEESLNRNQFNLQKLKAYAFKLYLFLMECYHVDKRFL